MGLLRNVGGRLVRPAYRPEPYTAPSTIADEIRAWNPSAGSEQLYDEEHHGPFMGLNFHELQERDGKRWMVLVQPIEGWAIEVEVTRSAPFEVHALPPEDAWRIAREWDARANPPIDVES